MVNDKESNYQFARMCTDYSKEHNLPFQMVLALKMSEKRISKALNDLKLLNEKLLKSTIPERNYIKHELHEVGEFRIKVALINLGFPPCYSRFINEEYVKNIIWNNVSFNN